MSPESLIQGWGGGGAGVAAGHRGFLNLTEGLECFGDPPQGRKKYMMAYVENEL